MADITKSAGPVFAPAMTSRLSLAAKLYSIFALFAVLVILVQFGGSLLVIWGGRLAWLGAGALGVFTVLATLAAHAWWTKSGIERFRDFNTFWEHMGLVGGLMLAAVLAQRKARQEGPTERTSATG